MKGSKVVQYESHIDEVAGSMRVSSPKLSGARRIALPGPTLDHAWANVERLMLDAGVKSFVMNRCDEDSDGRCWLFEVEFTDACGRERHVDIDMPGLPLHHMKVAQRNVDWFVPRLFVDGNSWLWQYAVEIVRGEEEGK